MTDFKEVPTDQLLNFQDFTPVHEASFSNAQLNIDIEKHDTFTDSYKENSNKDNLKEFDDNIDSKGNQKSIWSIEYYQQLFDVDTSDVTERIWNSIIPRNHNLIRNKIKLRPDLYGPVWISITLVFTIAISGNIASYFQHIDEKKHWKYNFHLVSYAATAIYTYIGLIPIGLWAVLKWSIDTNIELDEESEPPKIGELICIYGYSLFIYIPVSILWTIQIYFLQWMLVITAAVLSASVLVLTLMSTIKRSKFKLFIIIGILGFHFLLAAGFMLYFFHVPSTH